jgi:hypothetical protein
MSKEIAEAVLDGHYAIRAIPSRYASQGMMMWALFGYMLGEAWHDTRFDVWCCRTVAGKRTRAYRKLYCARE